MLADGWLYPLWVVGASRMREVDDSWPATGASSTTRSGPGRRSSTTRPRSLERAAAVDDRLRARAWPAGEAERDRSGCSAVGDAAPRSPSRRTPSPALAPRARARPRRRAEVAQRERLLRLPGLPSTMPPRRRVERRDRRDVRRRRGRRRPQRAGRRQPPRRPGLVGPRPRGAAEVGGAVASDRRRHPGFVHDTFSAFYPLAPASPASGRSARGARAALASCPGRARSPAAGRAGPCSTPTARHCRGSTGRTAATARRGSTSVTTGTGSATADRGPLAPFPPVRGGARRACQLPAVGGPRFVKTLLTPAPRWVAHRFGGVRPADPARRQRRPRRHPARRPRLRAVRRC